MKKNLLLAAIVVAFAGSAQAIKFGAGTIEVRNKTQGDIWVTFNTTFSKCIGGCDYVRIAAGEKKSTWGSLTGKLLNVYVYEGCTHAVKKGYSVQGDVVEVRLNGKVVDLQEPGK